ncbi:hypothetical protein HYW20_05755 [Candidatus Woesearchaeota archaeon]|nr:hypothetical protein [Candidatus Woesearchaeota archaeon]
MGLLEENRKILEKMISGSNGNPIDIAPTLESIRGGVYCSIQIRSNGKPHPLNPKTPYDGGLDDNIIQFVQDVFLVEAYVNSEGKKSTVNGKDSKELKSKLKEYHNLKTQLDGHIKETKLGTDVDLDTYTSLFKRTREARVAFVNLAQEYIKHQDVKVNSPYARLQHAFSHIL